MTLPTEFLGELLLLGSWRCRRFRNFLKKKLPATFSSPKIALPHKCCWWSGVLEASGRSNQVSSP